MQTTPLLPYYVYVLIDPRNSEVIYVGKGTGNRIAAHWGATRALLAADRELHSDKLGRLGAIAATGLEPTQLVVGRYETEEEAYAVEATLIEWVYGFDRLTNAVRGHGCRLIRPRGSVDLIPGIDVPAAERINDGSFKREKVEGLAAADVYSLMGEIESALQAEGFRVRDFSLREDRAFDPGESNGCLARIVEVGDIDLAISITKRRRPSISVLTTTRTRLASAQLERLGLSIERAKNIKVNGIGRYIDFPARIVLDDGDVPGVVLHMQRLRGLLTVDEAAA